MFQFALDGRKVFALYFDDNDRKKKERIFERKKKYLTCHTCQKPSSANASLCVQEVTKSRGDNKKTLIVCQQFGTGALHGSFVRRLQEECLLVNTV